LHILALENWQFTYQHSAWSDDRYCIPIRQTLHEHIASVPLKIQFLIGRNYVVRHEIMLFSPPFVGSKLSTKRYVDTLFTRIWKGTMNRTGEEATSWATIHEILIQSRVLISRTPIINMKRRPIMWEIVTSFDTNFLNKGRTLTLKPTKVRTE